MNAVRYDEIRDTLRTGDLVLFRGSGLFGALIKAMSGPWTHVGMVVRPVNLDMVLLWHATMWGIAPDVELGVKSYGVQLVALRDLLRRSHYEMVAVRRADRPLQPEQEHMLGALRSRTSGIPYEDRIEELLRAARDAGMFGAIQKEDLSALFCSELVAEACQAVDRLPDTVEHGLPSNEYTPTDLSEEARRTIAWRNVVWTPQLRIEI